MAARLEWVGVGASKAKCQVWKRCLLAGIHQKKRKQIVGGCSGQPKASHQCPVSGLQERQLPTAAGRAKQRDPRLLWCVKVAKCLVTTLP